MGHGAYALFPPDRGPHGGPGLHGAGWPPSSSASTTSTSSSTGHARRRRTSTLGRSATSTATGTSQRARRSCGSSWRHGAWSSPEGPRALFGRAVVWLVNNRGAAARCDDAGWKGGRRPPGGERPAGPGRPGLVPGGEPLAGQRQVHRGPRRRSSSFRRTAGRPDRAAVQTVMWPDLAR